MGIEYGFTSACDLVFDTTGERIRGTGACTSCEVGLSVNATLNTERTTCGAGHVAAWSEGGSWSSNYAIDDLGDGTSSWKFPSDATEFGVGPFSETAAGFVSDVQCGIIDWSMTGTGSR